MSPSSHIGRTLVDSTADSEPDVARPSGPNIVVIVLDDTGFSDLGCFGSRVRTSNIDALAARGLRSRAFHVTAVCSPTRAALLTGRNHHSVGMGSLSDFPMRFPGYRARLPSTAAMLPRVLRDAGYSTFAVGKWHLTPTDERSFVGPVTRWPLAMGFERYYGFLAGAGDQYAPELTRDNTPIATPAGDGYHLTEDLADQAIAYLNAHHEAEPARPFFLYFAPGAMHSPHQVPAEWIAPYESAFDDGWDALRAQTLERQIAEGVIPPESRLSPRPPWVTAWDDLDDRRRRVYARQMEIYAGFLTHTDAQIGRVLDRIEEIDKRDDTVVVLLSDNGASAEGGAEGLAYDMDDPSGSEHPRGDDFEAVHDHVVTRLDRLGGPGLYNHYSWGWALAGNTPFPLWKRYSWLGGVRVPFIVSWPARLASGEIRDQFAHAIDLMPTLLEAAGVAMPEFVDGHRQMPLHGASLLATWDSGDAPPARSTQYFETLGSRGLYHDGWMVVTDHIDHTEPAEGALMTGSRDFADDRWRLYDLRNDFAQTSDLSEDHPARTREMIERWWHEAGRYGVLPLVSGQFYNDPSPERRAVTVLSPGLPDRED